MTQNQELLPCPFCGSADAPMVDTDENDGARIVCNLLVMGCGGQSLTVNEWADDRDIERVIKAWNTRTEIPHD